MSDVPMIPSPGPFARLRNASLCAVPAAGAGGGGTTDEFAPLALALAALTGAAVWMFRRWRAPEPARTSAPAVRPDAVPEI